MTLGIPSCRKGIYGLKAAQACFLQNTFASWLVFYIPCQAELHNHSPMLIWLTQGDICTLSMHLVRNIYTTIWAYQLFFAVYVKQRSSSFAKESCCKEVFFATAVVSLILHYSLSSMITSPLTISSEASSLGGIYWSVTWPKIFLSHLFLSPDSSFSVIIILQLM